MRGPLRILPANDQVGPGGMARSKRSIAGFRLAEKVF